MKILRLVLMLIMLSLLILDIRDDANLGAWVFLVVTKLACIPLAIVINKLGKLVD